MTELKPMSDAAFSAYLSVAAAKYADSNVAPGLWPREGALERARAAYRTLLPQGLLTPNNHLFEIQADSDGEAIGMLWFSVNDKNGAKTAFIYDIFIEPGFRRQGHAQRALKKLEALPVQHGALSVGLHVFSFNHEAQKLYAKAGYVTTGVFMNKMKVGGGA